jgi:hypothetical protein
MKKLSLPFALLVYQLALGQTVEWQRQFSMGNTISTASGIVNYDDSLCYAAIGAGKWGYNIQNPPNTAYGIGLAKIKASNGDTVFVKRVNGWTSGISHMKLYKTFEGNLIIASKSVGDTIFNSKILVQKIETNGNPIWVLPISVGLSNPRLVKVVPATDGGTYILGSDISTIGGFQDWLLIKVSYNGQLMWSQRYSGGTNWYCEANNIEPLRNGNYLISGMAERTIWSVEVDADGNQIDQHTFWYGSVPNLVFDAVVRQTSYKSFAVSGTYASNPRTLFLGKFDSIETRIWGGETEGRFARIQASTSEGKIIVLDGRAIVNDSLFLTIYNPDSSIIWRLGLPRSGLTPNNPEINDIVFDGNGGVILCGSKKRQNSNRDELFFMKISGVGLPYDPFADTVLLEVYPNPGREKVWFSGFEGKVELRLFSSEGRLVYQGWVDNGLPVSLSYLPKGLYSYVVRQQNQQWTGKWIKE